MQDSPSNGVPCLADTELRRPAIPPVAGSLGVRALAPTGQSPLAQGWRVAPTLGEWSRIIANPNGVGSPCHQTAPTSSGLAATAAVLPG